MQFITYTRAYLVVESDAGQTALHRERHKDGAIECHANRRKLTLVSRLELPEPCIDKTVVTSHIQFFHNGTLKHSWTHR